MFIQKKFTLLGLIQFTGWHTLWLIIWTLAITIIHETFHSNWMSIPWLPISIIGTAVAFYVGFKNNQAYDRLWEARKIWGAIVNSVELGGVL